jgi:hypothetical protein
MPPKLSKSPFAMLIGRHKDKEIDNNFQEIKKSLDDTHPVVKSRNAGPIDLAVGLNYIPLPIPKPDGRIITYQSAPADLTDSGVQGNYWLITASAACTIKLLFF